MRVIKCENYDEMSRVAARIVAAQLVLKPDSVLGLATGSTPVGMYAELVKMNKEGKIDFADVKTFNLDEYFPIDRANDQSYYYFMNDNLYSKVNMKPENVYIPNGSAKCADEECKSYEMKIEDNCGVDLQVLGIGNNGHIGFNEPADELSDVTHKIAISESTVEANSRFFASADDVPREALTMGMATIMKARKIILMVSGANKNAVLKKVLSGKITTDVPATMLNMHSDVVIIADKDALA